MTSWICVLPVGLVECVVCYTLSKLLPPRNDKFCLRMPGMHRSSSFLDHLKLVAPNVMPAELSSSAISQVASSEWPTSFTTIKQQSPSSVSTWPSIPDSFCKWPAKGPPSDTLSKMPYKMSLAVELGQGDRYCLKCKKRLRDGLCLCCESPQCATWVLRDFSAAEPWRTARLTSCSLVLSFWQARCVSTTLTTRPTIAA